MGSARMRAPLRQRGHGRRLVPPLQGQGHHLEADAWEDFLDTCVGQAGVWAGENIEPEKRTLKTTLERLIETYADEGGIDLIGCGSWTVRKEGEACGAEADECSVLGPIQAPPEVPDLAVEVVWTSGGLDKLDVYRGLGVPEVWFWQGGALGIYVLAGDVYHQAPAAARCRGWTPT